VSPCGATQSKETVCAKGTVWKKPSPLAQKRMCVGASLCLEVVSKVALTRVEHGTLPVEVLTEMGFYGSG
jgi:hypothetical protein